ncbi:MAG: undecaprenyl-diphosphate phosphatase, partial [Acholeplasmatales bacterium]|nr:undecaprenyl-diphosphate phosphatase [Acholeplasmatales bacterium]
MLLSTFLNLLKSVLYGIIEGITEWLPISSTGHMILLDEWLKVEGIYGKSFWDLFLVVIQLGAIIAVVLCFFSKLWPFSKTKTSEEKKDTWRLWLNVLIACVPAAIIGLLLDDWLNEHFYNFTTVAIMLIVYGVLFIVIERFNKKRTFKITDCKQITWKLALIIGLVQLLALIPGTSRSGVTILGAMLIGLNRETSAEFSFFLSIPVMFGASLLKIVKFFIEGNAITGDQLAFLGVGCIVAFLVSIVVI